MVKLGVIGDTQGRYRLDELMDKVTRSFKGVDAIWHAGDWQDPAVLERLKELAPLTVVNGNAPDDPRYPERVVQKLDELEVGMVHRPPRAGDEWAAKLDLVIHGHTHRWRDEKVGRTRFINVSTPTAAGFSAERTIGILTVDGDQADLLKINL